MKIKKYYQDHKYFLSILNAIPHGIYIVNKEYDIQYINSVIEQAFGPVAGQKCYQYFHERTEVCPWCKNDTVFSGNSVRWEWYSKKNNKHYDLYDTPITNQDGTISKLEIFTDITAFKHSEERYKQAIKALHRYEQIIEATDDHMSFVDQNYIYLAVNNAYLEGHQKTRDDIIGRSVRELLGRDLFEQSVKEQLDRCLAGEEIHYQAWFSFPGKGQQYMDVSYYPFMNGDGEITGVVVSSHNSTKQQRMVDELKQANQFSENLIENANTLVVTLSAEALITSFNKYAEQITGYKKAEVIEKNGLELFIPQRDQETLRSIFTQVFLEMQDISEYETNIILKNGLEKQIKWKITILKDQFQKHTGALLVGMDITEAKEKEEALHKDNIQLQRYIKAIDEIGIGLCVIDADYRLHTMNKTLIDWFGDNRDSRCYEVVMGKTSPCSFCKLQNVVEQQETAHYQFTRSGGRTYEVVATPISNDDGTISKIEIIRDITEQQEQETRKIETSRQEEQRLKLESLKTMAGAIAHRFNNAMMAVQGNLELMKLTLPGDSEEYNMAANAAKAASGASQVGSMMLSYVGQKPLQLQTHSLPILVRESVTALKSCFQPPTSLKFYSPDQDLYCSVDQLQIKEVLESILTNAAESLEKSEGSIEITFGSEYYATSSFPLPFQGRNTQDGIYSFCQIKDSGHGIEPENLLRIFEPFYTTRFVGRGLGLAMTVGVMQSHHGAVIVKSSPGEGTTVRLLLLIMDSSSQETIYPATDKEAEAVQLSGDILFADDEEIVLEVGRKMLEALGYTVHTAIDGQEAVNKILKKDTDFCAVILDVSMPKMDGIEAMHTIRKMNPALPIVLSSGYAEDEFPFNKEQGGKPDAFLSKPFQLSDMRSNLERIMADVD